MTLHITILEDEPSSARQLAALLRFTGWNDDKMIRDEAFRQALAELKSRRTGGGRR